MAKEQKTGHPRPQEKTTLKKQSSTPASQPVELAENNDRQPLTPLSPVPNQDKQVAQHILHWQRVAGNQVVAQAIQRQARLTAQTISADRVTRPAIQRDHSEHDMTTEVTTPIRVVVTLGPPGTTTTVVQVRTYGDLWEAYGQLGSAMFFDDDDFFPDGSDNEHYQEWENLEGSVDGLTNFYRSKTATEAPVIAEVLDMQEKMAEARSLALRCRRSFLQKEADFRRELGEARRQALHAEAETRKLLRMQFLSGDDSGDLDAAFLWSMADSLGDFAGEIAGLMELSIMQSRVVQVITGAITLANVYLNWSSQSPMLMGSAFEGLPALNNVLSLAGAANSFFINPAYVVTAYIGPMLNVITNLLGTLQAQLIERNDDAADFLGVPMYIGAEPGGEPMWNYMVTAMQASSAADIPRPSGDVFDYFDEFRKRFDEFGASQYEGEMENYTHGDRDEFPTRPGNIPTESSWLFWTDVNDEAFPTWLLRNRQMVWTLLYGARDPANARRTTD